MMFTTKTEVTLVMSGAEADELATWMHENNACGDNKESTSTAFHSAIASNLLHRLRDLPPNGELRC